MTTRRSAKRDTYVDFLMHEWGMTEQSERIQTWMRRILGEIHVEALLDLRREPNVNAG